MKIDEIFKLNINEKREQIIWRFFEILPGFLSWSTIILSVLLSFIKPVWVAIFIICFDVYWFIKAIYLAMNLLSSYKHLNLNIKRDWLEIVKEKNGWDDYYHLVILPTFKEGIEIINPTFEALKNCNYPNDKIIVVFAGEERDRERAIKNAKIIEEKYGHIFYKFMVTIHPDDITGEIAGKGSNETWAARQATKFIDERNIPYEKIILSVLDIDTCVHKEYFGILTQKFMTVKNPHQVSYQPIPMFYNNIWDSPILMRLVAMNTTFWMMMEQSKPEKLVTFSSHSMSFKTLVDIGFWDTDVVSEDAHIFWQCFMHYNGEYRVEPLLTPVYMDTVLADTYKQSIINQYKQQRRWAYGVEDVPYIFLNFFRNNNIKITKKLKFGFWSLEGYHSWATNALIIFLLGWLPLLLGGDQFTKTLLAQSLPVVTQILMTIAMLGMIISATVNVLIMPDRPDGKKGKKISSILIQWLFLPITTILLGSIPAYESQTRLMLGKYMGFWVTEKVRKKK